MQIRQILASNFEKLGSTPILKTDPYFKNSVRPLFFLAGRAIAADYVMTVGTFNAPVGHHPARIGGVTGTSTQPPGPAMNRPPALSIQNRRSGRLRRSKIANNVPHALNEQVVAEPVEK